MLKQKNVPIPVISEEILKKIHEEVNDLKCTPASPILESYFKNRIKGDQTRTKFTRCDYDEISKSLFPQLKSQTSNIDQLLDYYIVHYPAYECLRERYYNSIVIKAMTMEIDEDKIFKHWFKEFFCYLKVKLDELPKLMMFSGNTEVGTMTKPSKSNESKTSDICLEIKGPTKIINNLVFSTINDDVHVRFHRNNHLKSFKYDGVLNSLMNYPNVKVTVNLGIIVPLISFSRTCACSYDRFIVNKFKPEQKKFFDLNLTSTSKNKSKSENSPNVVESVELVKAKESVVYTHELINEYVKTLIGLIKNCSERVSDVKKQELILILNEFVADIAEINMYNQSVIATNTSIKYKMGTTKYERYRFVKKTDINFIEILRPTITLHLDEFNPMIDNHNELYFKQLRLFAHNLKQFEDLLLKENSLVFHCMLCEYSLHYDSGGIIEHIQKDHEPEVRVVCEKCQLSVEVETLAANRWKHCCFE